ncbi:hypothetical protein WDU94_014140 [Cyamophila willieti]
MAESNVNYIMKNTFLIWKTQTKKKIEKKKCHALANKIYHLTVYNETWQRWCQHIEQRKNLRRMKHQAKTIHVFVMLKYSWQHWRIELEHVKTCRDKSKQVEALWEKKTVMTCLTIWRNYANEYHRNKTRIDKLNSLKRNLCYRQILVKWQSVLTESRNQQTLIGKALELRKKEILNAWQRELNLSKYKERRMNDLMRIRYSNLSRTCFEQWKIYLRIRFEENLKMEKLSSLYRRMNVGRYFLVWIQWKREEQERRQEQDRKQREVREIQVKQIFEVWREKYQHLKDLNDKIEQTKNIFDNISVIKYLHAWRNYSKDRLRRKLNCLKMKNFVEKLEMRIYLNHWREKLGIELRNKDMTAQALIHWSIELTRKAFNTWTQYSQVKKMRKLRYTEAMEQHNSFVLIKGLRTLLQKGTKELVQRNEQAMENAKQNEGILFKYFTRWRQCVRYNEDILVKNKVVTLPGNPQSEENHTKRTEGNNFECFQRPVRFANVPISRNEPKIPQFLTTLQYNPML